MLRGGVFKLKMTIYYTNKLEDGTLLDAWKIGKCEDCKKDKQEIIDINTEKGVKWVCDDCWNKRLLAKANEGKGLFA